MSIYARTVLPIVLACAVAGGVGYWVGASGAPSQEEAANRGAEAESAAYAKAAPAAASISRKRAYVVGKRRARKSGERSGRADGEKAGAQEASKRAEAAKQQQTASRPCMQMDVGVFAGQCLPAGPGDGYGDCPPGYVPNASGGVLCLPVRGGE